MLSPDTQNLLSRILLALAEGERSVEEARKEISNEDSYDIQAIFRVLDNNGDNYITPKDIQKYLNSHGLEVNLIEVKLLILFYDQDHDFTLTYGEIFKIIHPGKEFPKIPQYKNDEELNVRVDRKLYDLLEKEISMARIILALLDEIKHKNDFNIHSAFHALKYYACITGDSINIFLKNCGMRPTAGDIRAIVKRLDINKDEIIDFCEFHAFLGFPDCTFCCPCFPCGTCGAKYCEECLQDIPCYLLGCDHKGMDSKMRCTSFEHNPRIGVMNSLYSSIKPGSMRQKKFGSRRGEDEEDEKNDDYSNRGGFGKNSGMYGNNNQNYPHGFNRGQYYSPMRKGFNGGNLSPEQFKLLQGLTNPEQLHKFMTISGILDRQNSEEINLTDNLSLRLSPIRDFDPKEWGCKNCPCNIHSNPNIPCDCCSCNVCPFKSHNTNSNPTKQKQLKFPRMPIYSYSYCYELDNDGPSQSLLSTNYFDTNSPKRSNVIFDKRTNKYIRSNPNSSDEEEYSNYMQKVNNLKDNFDKRNKNVNDPNSMIYNDDMANDNYPNKNKNNLNRNKNRNGNINNEEEYDDNNINENIEEIRKYKTLNNKIYKNEENMIKNEIIKGKRNIRKYNNNEEKYNDFENENNNEDYNGNKDEGNNNRYNQNPNQMQNNNNNNDMNNNINNIPPNNYSPNNKNINPNFNNNPQNPQGNQDNMPYTAPNFYHPKNNNDPNNPNNNMGRTSNINNDNYDFFNDYNKEPLYKTFYPNNKNNKNKSKPFISGSMEEESEDDGGSNYLYKSHEEIIDENEKLFLQYLKALIKSEREIEFAKRDLMRQSDFNAEDAFRLFEVQGSGVVTKKDLKFGLKLLGIKPTDNQIDIILNKYDLDLNGFLDYEDFFDMVISFKDEDRKREEKRKSNRNVMNRNIEIFTPETRELYKKLFLVIIEEEERLEEFRQNLNIDENMMKEIFYKINVDKDGLCNKYEFASYCLRKKVCKEKKDAYLAFIRFNRNRDGGLESKELSIELKSSVLGK